MSTSLDPRATIAFLVSLSIAGWVLAFIYMYLSRAGHKRLEQYRKSYCQIHDRCELIYNEAIKAMPQLKQYHGAEFANKLAELLRLTYDLLGPGDLASLQRDVIAKAGELDRVTTLLAEDCLQAKLGGQPAAEQVGALIAFYKLAKSMVHGPEWAAYSQKEQQCKEAEKRAEEAEAKLRELSEGSDATEASEAELAEADESKQDNEEYSPTQLVRIFLCMSDMEWRTIQEIARITGDPVLSVGARLRELRGDPCGAHDVGRRLRPKWAREDGMYQYRIIYNHLRFNSFKEAVEHLIPSSKRRKEQDERA